jgi:hypothetical protein
VVTKDFKDVKQNPNTALMSTSKVYGNQCGMYFVF